MKSKLLKQILFSEKGLRIGWIILIFILLIVLSEILIVDPIGWLLEKIGISGVKGDFAQAFLVHRNLWLPIGIHFAWHFAGRTMGTVGVTGENALFLATKVQGPALLVDPKSGGAGLFELIGVVVVSLILWQMSNRAK